MDFSIYIVGGEATINPLGYGQAENRNTSGVDGESCLFHHFTVYGLLKGFACLDKASHKSIEVALEVAGMYQKDFLSPAYEDDDGSGERGPYRLAALSAFLADIGRHLHGCSAYSAELCVLVPVDEFMAFSCLEVQVSAQFVVTGTESAHLIVGIVGDGGVDGESLYLGSVFHRTDVENMGPGLEFYRTLFRAGNGVASVCQFLQQEVGLAKYKPIGHFFIYSLC